MHTHAHVHPHAQTYKQPTSLTTSSAALPPPGPHTQTHMRTCTHAHTRTCTPPRTYTQTAHLSKDVFCCPAPSRPSRPSLFQALLSVLIIDLLLLGVRQHLRRQIMFCSSHFSFLKNLFLSLVIYLLSWVRQYLRRQIMFFCRTVLDFTGSLPHNGHKHQTGHKCSRLARTVYIHRI